MAVQSEIAIQTLFRSRARILCPAVHVVAVPNGTHIASRAGRAKVRREGLATGFPDIMCLWSHGNGPENIIPVSAYIEFKSAKGRISENQSEWIERLGRMGFPVAVCRDADHAIEWLRSIGAPFIDRRGL